MDVSVIIVNYNVRFFLEQCIRSVLAASKKMNVEIIVVDNNSQDTSVGAVYDKFPQVHLIKNSKNLGFSKAVNQGVKKAKGAYILMLNPDTVIAEDTLEMVFNFAENKKNLGVVGVKLLDGSGNFSEESKRNIPSRTSALGKFLGIPLSKKQSYYNISLNKDEAGESQILSGAFMFVKRAVFYEVNGLDEDYFMYGEDIDLCYKILKKGYTNFYFPKTSIIHYKGESTLKNKIYVGYFYNSIGLFYKKHFKFSFFSNAIVQLGIFLFKWLHYIKIKMYQKKKSSTIFIKSNNLEANIYKEKEAQLFYVSKNLEGNFKEIVDLAKAKNKDTLVFDNAIFSNKSIIKHFEKMSQSNLEFRIHPNHTNFIIGSSNPFKNGEIFVL